MSLFTSKYNWNDLKPFNETFATEHDFVGDEREQLNLTIVKTNSTYKNCLNSSDGLANQLKWHKTIRPNYCTDDITDVFLIRSSIFRNSLRLVLRSTWAQDVTIEGDKTEK